MALVKLGALKRESGAHGEAEQLFAQAVDVSTRAWGQNDLRLVPALTGLGTARILLGRAEAAQPVLTRAVDLSESQLGEAHPDLVILLNDLSRLYLKQSAFRFAEPLLTRLLAIKRAKGEDHPEVATVLASLAAVHQALGRHEMAEQAWRRVLDIRERTLAPNHFSTATALESLAETCSARGKMREALQCYQRAFAIRELTLGVEHESLRRLRERISDVQMQADQNSLEMDVDAQAPTDRTSVPALDTPLYYEQPPRQPAPEAPVRKTVMRAAPMSIAIPDDRQVPPPATNASYMNVLMDIQQEMDEESTDLVPAARPAAFLATASAFFRAHRVGSSVAIALALPALAFAVVRGRGTTNGWAQNNVAVLPQGSAALGPSEPFSRPVEPVRDSIAVVSKSASRGSDETTTVKRSGDVTRSVNREDPPQPEEPTVTPVTLPLISMPAMARLDSAVKAGNSPVRSGAGALSDDLAVSSELARRDNGDLLLSSETYTRARLIGEMPVPELPERLRASGDVVARFDVDTSGRPVAASIRIVRSPNARLSEAVKKVIPAMRFEPARLPGPRGTPITDAVEITMQFVAKR